jgi:hypothetical protein
MIVVTGMARTGTSNMVKTLLNMGYKTPAPKFLPEHEPIKESNPKGFYELLDEVHHGVKTSEYKGMVVKLFPYSLNLTDPELIDKLIVCTRDKDECLESYRPIHKAMKDPATPEIVYEANIKLIEELKERLGHIEIDLSEFKTPEKVYRKIKNYLCQS